MVSIMDKESLLTQEYLKYILHYNPETGIFTRKRPTGYGTKKGQVVGSERSKGYLGVSINTKSYLLHRLAWFYTTNRWPKDQIDHINGVKNDNRWCNLREATNKQNCLAQGVRSDNTSGYKGVYWHKASQKWLASVQINVGAFDNKHDAAKAYNKAAKEYFGEFAYLNEIVGHNYEY